MPFNFKEGFLIMIREFCENTSLSGYKYTVEKERSLFERVLWSVCHLTLMITTVYLTSNLWFAFMKNPTITSLQTTSYPVDQVPFPGIAICNINKISKSKAEEFAKYLAKLTHYSETYLLAKVRLLGHMYDFDSSELDQFMEFQTILDKYNDHTDVNLHPKSIIRSLITPCEELLKYCKWGGKIYNCSEIFELRLTFEGYCCTFNYIKRENSFSYNKSTVGTEEEIVYQKAGYENGLTVVVNNNPDDYFYSVLAAVGVTMHIFHSKDYPDVASGSLVEELIGYGTENFLGINPTVFTTIDAVINYPLEKRLCYFSSERQTVLGEYSESDCLVDCRIKSMMSLCECVPFMIPTDDEQNICTLADIPCLSKYKDKWNSLAPAGSVGEELNREIHDALHCETRCYSACENIIYEVVTNPVPISLKNKGLTRIKENDSIIHVYNRKSFVHLYKQDVVYYWFEILSNFGGTFGLIIGLSLISIIELLVYIFYKWLVFSQFNS